jgi:Methyltransferase domain
MWLGRAGDRSNFDASPTLLFERVPLAKRIYIKNDRPFPPNVRFGNIVKGLPVKQASCALLYCSHVLEHLSLQDFSSALANSYRVLCPGGVWRIVVPNLHLEAERYRQSEDREAAVLFLEATGLGEERPPRTLAGHISQAFSSSRHRWLWNYASITSQLERAGIVKICRAYLGDAEFPAFTDVERPQRWDNALGIEGSRPC